LTPYRGNLKGMLTAFNVQPRLEETNLGIDPLEIARFVVRNWLLIALLTGGSLLLAGAYIALSTPRYTAAAQIFVNPPRERIQGTEGGVSELPMDVPALESQIILIKSTALLTQVANTQELIKDPEFNPFINPNTVRKVLRWLLGQGPVSAKEEMEAILYSMRRATVIARVGRSYVLSISVTTKTPAKSVLLSNAIAHAFMVDRISARTGSNYRSVRLIDQPVEPLSPAQPDKALVVVIGVIAGLMLGIAVAVILDLSQPGFTRPQQIESQLGIPVLSVLEELAPHKDPVDEVLKSPTSRFSDGVRSLRSALPHVSREQTTIVIQVSSTLPGEGKTVVTLCLAASAAAVGQRAVVVDCDLRQASLSHRLALLGRYGVSDFVHGRSSLSDVTCYDEYLKISAIPAGNGTIDPQHTLSSRRMGELIAGLRKSFEIIVIDSAPLDAVLDGALVAGLVDTTLLVIRWRATAPALVKNALLRLHGRTESVASILSRFDPARAVKFDPVAFNFTSSSYEKSFFRRLMNPSP
jgi:capsular exopolysaccharide synthesis family protein